MKIDVYSHGFSVSEIEPRNFAVINRMCRFMGHYEQQPNQQGRYDTVLTGVYGGGFADRSRFYFHINVLDKFISMVKDWTPDTTITETVHPLYETDHVDIFRKDMRPPRNGQERAIQFVIDPGSTKVICVEPGGGKTYILNQALVEISRRLGMVIKAQYLPKWEEDISKAHHVQEGDIAIIKGSVELIKLMNDALTGRLTAKYILISNSTYRPYLDLWETTNGGEMFPYPLAPHELWGVLGCEVLAIDEGHQDFHFNHRCIVYSHVPKLVVLSGTIDPDNEFKHAVTRITFPPEVRFILPPIPPYLKITAYTYSFRDRNKIKWNNRGRPDYSQIALEKSLLGNKPLLAAYTQMIVNLVKDRHGKIWKHGRVGLVFAATKLMCTHLHKHVAKAYPDRRVLRFIGGDPYSNLSNADILISTTKSCGTAKDIPGLAYVIMTEAIGDTQANGQHVKRLRKPDDGPDYFTPEFLYFLCEDIQQHAVYHRKKKEVFSKIALSHLVEYSGLEL